MMKRLQTITKHPPKASMIACTLPEALIAVFAAAVMLTALYASFAFGFAAVKLARQDLRATQILQQRIETLRLSNFTDIQNSTTNDCFDPTDQASGGGGTLYTVTINASTPTTTDMPTQPVYYMNKMLKVTATAIWTNGNILRTRSLQTYVAKNGIQSYLYNPQ